MSDFFKSHGRRVVGLIVIVALYWSARLPVLSDIERVELANRFAFQRFPLAEVPGPEKHDSRPVHPDLQHMAAWISTVGAAVALNDLDGDGLANDLCYVETRTDQVIVAPVPGTAERYAPFTLRMEPLPYDAATMAPMGCVPGDLNEDGLMDIVVYYWGRTPVAFLRRAASQSKPLHHSSYWPCEIAPSVDRWYTNALTMADLDGDTHVDLIIGNYFPDGARVLDVRGGGREQMQDSMSRAYNGGHNRVLLWQDAVSGNSPSVTFEEIAGVFDEQVAQGWTLGAGAADLDGDLLPEIYFAQDFGPDRLLHNQSQPGRPRFARLDGEKTFTMPNSKVLGRDSFKGMSVDFGDLNCDGWLDISVSNIADEYALEESHFAWVSTGEVKRMAAGVAPYLDRSESLGLSRSGWGWETRFGDFDNDGVLELLQATGFIKGRIGRWPQLHELAMSNDAVVHRPGSWARYDIGDDLSGHQHTPFFVRAADGRFYDLAVSLGLGDVQVSRGIATADVDGDGDLDYAVANQWEPSFFYRNDCPKPGAFLGLHILWPVGPERITETQILPGHPTDGIKGRPAIGTEARVLLPDGRLLVAQVDGGNGHSGARSPDLHFGLGAWPTDDRVKLELKWRDADLEVRRGRYELSPGWYTVILGSSGQESDAQ